MTRTGGRFDVAVIVSNDSDLLEPIKIVREELGKKVGILNPHRRPSRALLHILISSRLFARVPSERRSFRLR